MPREVNLLVLGAGAGGMIAALTAAVLGLRVLLIEKTGLVGGGSARSGMPYLEEESLRYERMGALHTDGSGDSWSNIYCGSLRPSTPRSAAKRRS